MKNITEFLKIDESRFKGHNYYRDDTDLVQDDKAIAEIWDDGTIEFYDGCDLDENERIDVLTNFSKTDGPLYYNGMTFDNGRCK